MIRFADALTKRSRRGYALILISVIAAVLSIVAANLIDLLRVESMLVRNDSLAEHAREVAEGGALEVIGDETTPDLLPLLNDPDLTAAYTPAADSVFDDPGDRDSYQAKVDLIRVAPLAESSSIYSLAVVHEVLTVSDVGPGDASFDLGTQIFKAAALRPGRVLPRRHAR